MFTLEKEHLTQHVLRQHRYARTKLRGITSQKTINLSICKNISQLHTQPNKFSNFRHTG